MAVERAERTPRPLLPEELEERIGNWFKRVAGGLLLAASAGSWLAIATWSARDPSLTHVTGMPVKNWLGPAGAVVSDVLLQTLGIAAVLALVATTVIGFELAVSGRIRCFKLRLGLFPSAVLALAAALSAIPAPDSWPLSHGLGGIGGDITLGLVSNLTAFVSPARPAFVGGVLMFGLGMCLLSAALGMDQSDWIKLLAFDGGGSRVKALLRRPLGAAMAAAAQRSEPKMHAGDAEDDGWPALASAPAAPAPSASAAARPGDEARRQTNIRDAGDDDLSLPQFLRSLTDRARGFAPHLPGFANARSAGAKPKASRLGEKEHEEADWRRSAGDADVRRRERAAIDAGPHAESRPSPAHDDDDVPADEAADSAMMARRIATSAHRAEPTKGAAMPGFRIFRSQAEPGWQRPSLNLLRRTGGAAQTARPDVAGPVLRGTARLVEDALGVFGVPARVRPLKSGPVVTSYEIEPTRTVSHERAADLADEIARAVGVASARIVAEPRRSALILELSNVQRETVWLRDILEGEVWRRSDAQLPIAAGVSTIGVPVIADLAELQGLLITGAPGSGRSTLLNALLTSLVYARGPAECRFVIIDPAQRELAAWTSCPHLLAPPAAEPSSALAVLEWVVAEIDERYKRMAKLGVRTVDLYNNRIRNARRRGEMVVRTVQTGFDPATGEPVFEREEMELRPMPRLVLVIAEAADVMASAGGEVEAALSRIASRGSGAGVSMLASTARPTADIVTAAVRGAFPARITLKLATKADSRRIAGEPGAERLLGEGDMIWMEPERTPLRAHAPFLREEDVSRVMDWARTQSKAVHDPNLVAIMEHSPAPGAEGSISPPSPPPEKALAGESDDLLDRAIAIVHREGRVSVSTLQRRLAISMTGAASLIARMEKEGLVTPPDDSGRRHVVCDPS